MDNHAQRSCSRVTFWQTHSIDNQIFLSLKVSGVFAEKNFSNDRLINEKFLKIVFELVQGGPDGNHFRISDLEFLVNGISVADCEDYGTKVAKLFLMQVRQKATEDWTKSTSLSVLSTRGLSSMTKRTSLVDCFLSKIYNLLSLRFWFNESFGQWGISFFE